MSIGSELFKLANNAEITSKLRHPAIQRLLAGLYGGAGGAAIGGATGAMGGLAYETLKNEEDKDYLGAMGRGAVGGMVGGGVAGAARGIHNKGMLSIPGKDVMVIPENFNGTVLNGKLDGKDVPMHFQNAMSGMLPGGALGVQMASKNKKQKSEE
jgi:hypothetical protein